MGRHFLHTAVFICLIAFYSSCRTNVLRGEGNIITAMPSVGSFARIDVELTLNTIVNVKAGAQPGISIKGYENLLKHIKAVVENNTLRIYSDLDETWEIKSEDVIVEVTVPAISGLKLVGAPDADIHGTITGSQFDLEMSGASTVNIDDVNVDHFVLDGSGASELNIMSGSARKAEYSISGSGEVHVFPVRTSETVAEISGAGSCDVSAAERLTASISGAGTIRYKGHPAISQDVSGAGTISDAN